MSALVREFSPAGPCLMLGQFVRRTAKTIVYREWLGGEHFGDERRVGGWKVKEAPSGRAYIHTEPCHCCRDHDRTQYPNGYMD